MKTKNEAQHTPTPWRDILSANGGRLIHIEQAETLLPVCSLPKAKATDAAFIVKAVNCHEELVLALEALTIAIRENEKVGTSKRPGFVLHKGHHITDPLVFAEAALAKAEGKE